MDERMLEVLAGALHTIDYEAWPETASPNSRHERAKADIVRVGTEFGYFAIPEIQPPGGSAKSRVDVGWYRDDDPVAAFEIDGTIKMNSIEKLDSFDDDVFKVIVSKSTNPTRIRTRIEKHLPEDFHHIDLQLYKYF